MGQGQQQQPQRVEPAPCRWVRRTPEPMRLMEVEAALRGAHGDAKVRAVMDVLADQWETSTVEALAHPLEGDARSRDYAAGKAAAVNEIMEDLLRMMDGLNPDGSVRMAGEEEEDNENRW